MNRNDNPQTAVDEACEVFIHFDLVLEDGTIADSTRDSQPMRLVVGDGTLLRGLEAVLHGMRAGEHQRVRLDPRDTYGFPDEGNVHNMPRGEFRTDVELQPRQIIGFTTPGGDEVPGTIRAVTEDSVVVDFNHPLAGHAITFDVHVISVRAPERAGDRADG